MIAMPSLQCRLILQERLTDRCVTVTGGLTSKHVKSNHRRLTTPSRKSKERTNVMHDGDQENPNENRKKTAKFVKVSYFKSQL